MTGLAIATAGRGFLILLDAYHEEGLPLCLVCIFVYEAVEVAELWEILLVPAVRVEKVQDMWASAVLALT